MKVNDTELQDILSRALLTVIRLARRPQEPGLDLALESLQHSLVDPTSLEALESALETLKNEIIQSALGTATTKPSPPGTPPSPARPPLPQPLDEPKVIVEVKTSYLEILGTLDVDLGESYQAQLTDLRTRIAKAQRFRELLDLRIDLRKLVQRYANHIFIERKKSADFVSEIANRLGELERYLLVSMEHLQRNFQINTEFDARMAAAIGQTTESIQGVQEIEKLKKVVLTRLQTLTEAIKDKQSQDVARIASANQDIDAFKDHIDHIQEEISVAQETNKTLLYRLKFDGLTGAFNRMAYEEMAAVEMLRFQRYDRPFSLIIFDIDHFKDINDNFGHLIGDKCLKVIAANIKTVLRQNDVLARYGGDEFIILLPETPRDQAAGVAEKVRKKIEMTDFLVRGRKVVVTISLGVTEVNAQDQGPDAVLDRADQCLYQAKKAGRNMTRIG